MLICVFPLFLRRRCNDTNRLSAMLNSGFILGERNISIKIIIVEADPKELLKTTGKAEVKMSMYITNC